ncbi:UTP--glucose-1-phosphate uridylyltransferase [Lactiplantibacillus daowaiensis]|uniref:UTP--glucose-1-phosphate uridylyltransferase n=1 Tax=Lactiplantibacillus daowaiensis TaxID=2559918 RepID=A0ABW1RYF7_9LACO|nr:sugar phosphate nucleotidyltransferase [Lactiplantibacillus daowaiensis]
MKPVKKAVILAAGLGTRLLPTTKTMPQALLPIVDQPVIQYLVEEVRQAGITDILIVISKTADSIEDYYDANFELEDTLLARRQFQLLKTLNATTTTNLYFVRQSKPLGSGAALLAAQSFVGDEPCLVLTTDHLIPGQAALTKPLLVQFNQVHAPIVAMTATMPTTTLTSFDRHSDNLELGRYILTPEIFAILAHQTMTKGGECQLIDAIATLNQTQRVFVYNFTGPNNAINDKLSYVETIIAYGLQHPEIQVALRQYILDLANQLTPVKKAATVQVTFSKQRVKP